MLSRFLETIRKYPLLKLLLYSHAFVVAVLVAYYYYERAGLLWDSLLYMHVATDAETGEKLYQIVARGPSLLLPWNLLPQDVFWLAVDVLIVGTLTMCLAYRTVGDELRRQVADREKAATDSMREADERSAAADQRMRDVQAWEQRLEARESGIAGRESEATRREADARAYVEGKDAEIDKMNVALARLKGEAWELRKEVKQLRAGSGRRRN